MLQQYRTQLLEGIQQFPDDSRTQIRERFKREYMYLYRHDKKWLFNNLPINQIKGNQKQLWIGNLVIVNTIQKLKGFTKNSLC